MEHDLRADFVIIGGGLAGCVVASRLANAPSKPSVLILEAGPNPSSDHDVVTPIGGFALQGSVLDWQYHTAPTPATKERSHVLTAGKTLGGGSMLNYCGWSRGDASDYDHWASQAGGDQRWNYSGLLPYFRRSENWFDKQADSVQHGFAGPILVTSVAASDHKRVYPLGKPLRQAWMDLGVGETAACEGRNQGASDWLETWINGERQPVHQRYPLKGVTVITNTPVTKILFTEDSDSPAAVGAILQDGRQVLAQKEVILSAGALQTPTLLQISGIGPSSLLSSFSIPVVYDSPAVGATYFDHFALFQLFKLHPSATGLAIGHPDLADPAFSKGFPCDLVVNEGIPSSILSAALDADNITDSERAAFLQSSRCFIESLVMYHPYAPGIPVDGTFIATSVMLTLPTSRGRICLSSKHNSLEQPYIEPNYFSTSLDRVALVYGVRRMLQLTLKTSTLAPYIQEEVPPPGLEALTAESSDAAIEERIRAAGAAHFHPAGSVPVGKVLDAEMRVKGVKGLRVCDTSVFPSPVGGHPQASLYAVAEMAAEMILAGHMG